ncbi:hypothetical protein QQ045_012797 [Rhodiola kirilowii]
MRALSWNCRGLGHPRSVRELTELVRVYRQKIVGLSETKMDSRRISSIQNKLGFSYGFAVDSRGAAGGIALWWSEDLNITLISYSDLHIDALVLEDDTQFYLTVFYGEPAVHRRMNSWTVLRTLGSRRDRPCDTN